MSNDLRRSLRRALELNETHVDAARSAEVTLSADEASLLESLRANPGFEGYPKDQLDRHTIKHLLVSTTDSPVSVCERAARKAEILMAKGALTENLEAANEATSLCEADVPEERPAAPEGEGDLPQGDADSTSGEHDGEDHENPGKEEGDIPEDEPPVKQGDSGKGDASGTADKGYKDEPKESTEQHDDEDTYELEAEDDADRTTKSPSRKPKRRQTSKIPRIWTTSMRKIPPARS
jgi:hypothetical protein